MPLAAPLTLLVAGCGDRRAMPPTLDQLTPASAYSDARSSWCCLASLSARRSTSTPTPAPPASSQCRSRSRSTRCGPHRRPPAGRRDRPDLEQQQRDRRHAAGGPACRQLRRRLHDAAGQLIPSSVAVHLARARTSTRPTSSSSSRRRSAWSSHGETVVVQALIDDGAGHAQEGDATVSSPDYGPVTQACDPDGQGVLHLRIHGADAPHGAGTDQHQPACAGLAQQHGDLLSAIYVAAVPSITSVSPAEGTTGGGTEITVSGNSFVPASRRSTSTVSDHPGGDDVDGESVAIRSGRTPPAHIPGIVKLIGAHRRQRQQSADLLVHRPADPEAGRSVARAGCHADRDQDRRRQLPRPDPVLLGSVRRAACDPVGADADPSRPAPFETVSTEFRANLYLQPAAGTISILAHDDVAGDSMLVDAFTFDARPMKLLSKLTLLSLGVSAIPLAIAGYSSLRIGQGALRGAIEENELTVARRSPTTSAASCSTCRRSCASTRASSTSRARATTAPTPQGLLKFLQLVYHQSDDFCAVAMFDEHGSPVGTPAYMENPGTYDSFRNHEPMRPIDVESVGLMAPLGEAMNRGQGVGPVFLGGPRRVPHVVLAVAFDPSWAAASASWPPRSRSSASATTSASRSTTDTDVKLVDGARAPDRRRRDPGGGAHLEVQRFAGRARGRAAGGRLGRGVHRAAPSRSSARSRRRSPVRLRRRRRQDRRRRAAAGEPHPLGDAVLDRRLRRHRLDRRRARSRDGSSDRSSCWPAGSRQIAAGNLEARIEQDASRRARRSRRTRSTRWRSRSTARARQILAQTNEIMVWNQTLEKRVEDGTRELRQAQDMLLRSRALAALGELGAGVAHEINNPLAGVLGIAQLMLADLPANHPARPMAQDIEAQALRIRKIVVEPAAVRAAPGGRGRQAAGPAARARRRHRAVRAERSRRRRHRRGAPTTPRRRPRCAATPCQLQEAFIQLIRNARGAMPDGGTLTIATSGARRRAGARHHRRHRPRHQRRAPAAHLRSVLHHQGATGRASAWACRWCTRPSRTTAARSRSRATSTRARRSC